MNAEETVARLRKRYDVTLPSGLNVTIRLPKIRDCVRAGGIPLPVIAQMERAVSSNGDKPDTSADDFENMVRLQDELVMRTLVAIEGEPVTMTPEAIDEIEQPDYNELVAYAWRTKSPLAVETTSEASPPSPPQPQESPSDGSSNSGDEIPQPSSRMTS